MSVVDVMGKEVNIGDIVAFATAGKGASGFTSGEVVRIMNKSIEIEHIITPRAFKTYTRLTQRNTGCFAIVESKGEKI